MSVDACPCATRAHAIASVLSFGFRLCGMVEDGAARALAHLPHLGLREQHDVERDLRGDPGGQVERRADPRDGRADRVPHGPHRAGRAPRRRARTTSGPCVAERRERPRRAAELRRELERGEVLARVEQPRRATSRPSLRTSSAPPAGAASAPPSAWRGARRRARAHASAMRSRRSTNERDGVARDEHRGGVEHVLARRAPVDVAAAVAGGVGERADERLHRVAGRAALASRARRRRSGPRRTPRDRVRRLGRDDARLRLGQRERALGVEHRPQPGAVATRRADPVGDEERARTRQSAKKTVCRSPWRCTSNSSASSRARATSVARVLRRDRAEHGVARVRLRLVREVHPRQHRLQQPAREDEHDEVRRLPVDAPGLIVVNAKRPSASVPLRPQPKSPRTGRRRPPARSRPSRRGTGSPAPSSTRPTMRVPPETSSARGSLAEPEREERPDGLRRRLRKRHSSSGVAAGPPSTTSHR